ncbi:unnamed protein product [Prunus armeniaca]
MASTNLPPIMLDHLYSMDDDLKTEGPLLLLEDASKNPVVGDEPSPETAPVINPASISRCCIEKGIFPAVPLFFQYPCSISKGWSEWVDRELRDPSTCNILRRAQVLDAIFLSKLWDIHIEAKMLRHVVRRWSTATHTFVCSWGEFTPTLEDVANISRLPVCGDRSPFGIALTPEEIDSLAVLRRGAPTFPSTSLRFSNWIQYFGDANRQSPCRLAAFIALWLGRFVLCDFSQDCLHERVFPLALAIARGDTIPLAPMFLGHLYHLLNRTQLLEKSASGTMGVETLLNFGFLQVFLWERLKGLDVYSLPHSHAIKLVDWGNGSFMPNNLPLVCRWFKRMQRKGQNFLKLLDNVENFVFRPYGTSAETFTFVPFYTNASDTVEVPATVSQSNQFRKRALLNVAPIPLPTLGDHCVEVSVTYSPHRVRRQFGLDQGVPSSPNHDDLFALHRIFWSNDHIPASCRPIVLASKARVDGFSRGYQAYWNRCLSSFREFQSFPGDRLPPTTARLVGLVSEEKAIPLSQKRNLPFISKSGDIVGEFPKTKPKSGVQSPGGSGKSATPASGKRKREGERNVSEKQTVGTPKRFIPKVAPSGPPRTKEATPPKQPQSSKPAASGSRGRAGKVLETTPLRRKMGTTPKRKRSDTPPVSPQVTPKRRSVRILHARFSGTRTSTVEAAGTPTVVTVDDDSDDSDTTESEANVPEQENVDDASEDSDRDFNEGCSEDAFAYSSDCPGGQGGSDALFESTGSSTRRFSAEQAEHLASNLEIVPVVPSSFNTFDTLVEAALAGSSPTMTPTDSRDEMPTLQVTSPLPSIFQHFLQRDLDPAIPPAFPAAFRSNTFVVHTTLPVPSHVQPLLRATGPSPLALLLAVQCDNASTAENAQAIITVAGNTAAEHPRGMSWLEWEESFTAFMAFFDSGAQDLRSADELLPLYHRFNGYALFRGILVYPETVAALKKFLDKYGDFMDMTGITSSFLHCAAFRTLGLVLHGMDTMQLLDITDHRLLCWRDAVCEAMTLGFRVEPLLNLVKGLARAAFGARAVHNMKSNPGPDEIRAAAEALVFKQHELENQRRELRGLLSAQGVSSDSADCVMEAVTRSSHGASSVPF